MFGDGVAVRLWEGIPGSAQVTGSLVARSARAGIGAFGASVALAASTLECNEIDLDQEVTDGSEASFQDQGEVVCGCEGAVRECQVSKAQLAPPEAPGAAVP